MRFLFGKKYNREPNSHYILFLLLAHRSVRSFITDEALIQVNVAVLTDIYIHSSLKVDRTPSTIQRTRNVYIKIRVLKRDSACTYENQSVRMINYGRFQKNLKIRIRLLEIISALLSVSTLARKYVFDNFFPKRRREDLAGLR